MSAAYRWVTFALLALVTIIAFEAMAIGTAMPVVAGELGAVRSYGLAFSVMLTAQLLATVVAGVWTSQRGPLPSLYVGQVLFGLGSLVAGLAPSFPVLLAGRLVAGLGGGLVIVAIYVVIGRAYPAEVRPRVFGLISAAWVLPSLVGPPIAGFLATELSWRLVFLVVVPPTLACAAVVWYQRGHMGEDDAPTRDTTASDGGWRAQRGVLLLGLVIALATGLLQWGAELLVPPTLWPVAATVLGLAGIAFAFPRLVPDGTLRLARGLPSVMMSRLLLTAAFNGASVFVPLMLVTTRGLTPTVAGIMSTLGSLGWASGSWVQGRARYGGRRPDLVSFGGLALAVSLLVFAVTAGLGLPVWVLAAGSVVGGVGMGLAMSSVSVLALAISPVEEHGSTSSSLALADVLGAVLGIGGAGAVFAAWHDGLRSDIPVYVGMWLALAVVAAVVVPAGQRSRT